MAKFYMSSPPSYTDVPVVARRVLGGLPDSYHVCLEFGLNNSQFDAVVVSRKGVYVIEVKDFTHRITEEDDHTWIVHSAAEKREENPFGQVLQAATNLQHFLRLRSRDLLKERPINSSATFWSRAPIYRIVCVPRWNPENTITRTDDFALLTQCDPSIKYPLFLLDALFSRDWSGSRKAYNEELTDVEISEIIRALGLRLVDETTAIPGSLWRPLIDERAVAGFSMGLRESDINSIKEQIVRFPLLAIVGEPQIGKTSLAQHIAGELSAEGRSVLYHDFRLDNPAIMLERFLEKTRTPLQSGLDDNIAALLVALMDQEWMLVLDNFETVLDSKLLVSDKGLMRLLERLRSAASLLKSYVLFTSRYSILTSHGDQIPELSLRGVDANTAVPYLRRTYGWSEEQARAIHAIRFGHPHVMHRCSVDVQQKMQFGLSFEDAMKQLRPDALNMYASTYKQLCEDKDQNQKCVIEYVSLHPSGVTISALQWLKERRILSATPIDIVIRLHQKVALSKAENGRIYLLPLDQAYVYGQNEQRRQQHGEFAKYYRSRIDNTSKDAASQSTDDYELLFYHAIASESVEVAWDALFAFGWAERLYAAEWYEMLVDLLRQLKACGGFFDLPSEAVGEALRSEGVSLLELGSLSEAERSLNEAERRFALADARIKQADAIAELGMVARKKGFRGNDELTYYQLAFELLPSEVSNETKRVRSKLLSRQAKTLEREGGNPDEILSYLTESLSLAREIGDERLTAFRLGQLGAAHRDIRRDYGTAIKCLDEALSIATRLKDNSSTVAALSGLGAAHENARHFLLAETRYKEALNGTITSDVYGMLDRLGRLGHVEGSLKKFKESEGYYRRAVELARKVENQRAEAQNLDGLGAILRTKAGETANVDRDQLLATALDCHSRAVKIQEALAGEPIGMANRYQELGRTLLALDRPQDARVLFIKALATLAGATESPRVRRLRAFQFQRLAETLEATGQREDAALCYAVAERDFGMRDRREQERAKKRLERILSNLDSGTRQILLPRLLHLERESQQLLQNLAEPGSVGA